jgi:2-amino-4-hydroxy-6-hydroxymethyldihydropteridine diphosphokinase
MTTADPSPTRVWLAFGSNLGPRRENLRHALAALAPDCQLLAASPLYATEPVGYADQGWFLNGVAQMETRLSPSALLTKMQGIEQALGRQRRIRNGPRTIDLDILLYGSSEIHLPGLNVPHPRAHQRLFVVAPWSDMAPDLLLNGKALAAWRRELEQTGSAVEFHAAPPW